MVDNSKMVVVVGQTATGKSNLSMKIAQQFNGEIICGDSLTVYQDLSIGTAKPDLNSREKISHHLLDVVNVNQTFTVANFQHLAEEAIAKINQRGRLPILVGGTGLYIDSLLFNYNFGSSSDSSQQLQRQTIDHTRVRKNTLILGLFHPKAGDLRLAIKKRVDGMFQSGLKEEVGELVEKYSWSNPVLRNAIGYKEFELYHRQLISLNQLKHNIISSTLDLAKRQQTWFKRNPYIHWSTDNKDIMDQVKSFLS